MKRAEAIAKGFRYTGSISPVWDRDRWAQCLDRANAVKKMYKGADYRVVIESELKLLGPAKYKAIYGNDLFMKVRYFNQADEETYLNETHQRLLDELKREYEEKVAEEMQRYEKRKADYVEIMSIKKIKNF